MYASRGECTQVSSWAEWTGRLQVHGMRCDVSVAEDMAELGRYAKQQLGNLDFWINNAGQVTRKRMLADVDASDISSAVGESAWPSAMLWEGAGSCVGMGCRLYRHGIVMQNGKHIL